MKFYKDLLQVTAEMIDDPTTWLAFIQCNKTTAKFGRMYQKQKMNEFVRVREDVFVIIPIHKPTQINGGNWMTGNCKKLPVLPNGKIHGKNIVIVDRGNYEKHVMNCVNGKLHTGLIVLNEFVDECIMYRIDECGDIKITSDKDFDETYCVVIEVLVKNFDNVMITTLEFTFS